MAKGIGFLAVGVAALGLGVVGPASAQQMVGGGDNAQVVYSTTPQGNVVGGGRVSVRVGVSGGVITTYLDPLPATDSAGTPTLSGGGDMATVTYAPLPANTILARRTR